MSQNEIIDIAIFAAGCFWKVQKTFASIKGVLHTTVGYSGGHTKNPTYQQVCAGKTGHAEAIQIEYDSNLISYQQLLDIFWQLHDPTTLNQQGADIGTQYRSAIFAMDEEQQQLAEQSKKALEQSGKYQNAIVTQIEAAKEFYPAEEYHQHYLEKNK